MKKITYQKFYIGSLWFFWMTVNILKYKNGNITKIHIILSVIVTLLVFVYIIFYRGNKKE